MNRRRHATGLVVVLVALGMTARCGDPTDDDAKAFGLGLWVFPAVVAPGEAATLAVDATKPCGAKTACVVCLSVAPSGPEASAGSIYVTGSGDLVPAGQVLTLSGTFDGLRYVVYRAPSAPARDVVHALVRTGTSSCSAGDGTLNGDATVSIPVQVPPPEGPDADADDELIGDTIDETSGETIDETVGDAMSEPTPEVVEE